MSDSTPSSQPISTRQPPIVVGYLDAKNNRVYRYFKDAYEGKQFYAKKKKEGRQPKVYDVPVRPRPDFPLSIHKYSSQWIKKVRGETIYFGSAIEDPKGIAAEEEWNRVKDDLLAGRVPRPRAEDALTLEDLCNQFLTHHEARRDNKEIKPRTYQSYYATAKRVILILGRKLVVEHIGPNEFRRLKVEIVKVNSLIAQKNEMIRTRMIFKFAFDEGLIAEPVRFGKGFEGPTEIAINIQREETRQKHGSKYYEPEELRQILDKCEPQMKAIVLLAINTGFGQSDLSALPLSAIDQKPGWVYFSRVKNGRARRCPLWPETIEAIQEWITTRPLVSGATKDRVFYTRLGQVWVKENRTGSPADALGQEFSKLLVALGIKRKGVSFYALRHTFETVASGALDQIVVDAIMGHTIAGMKATYLELERIEDSRFERVVNHVRSWLFDNSCNEANDDNEQPPSLTSDDESGSQPESEGPRLRLFAG